MRQRVLEAIHEVQPDETAQVLERQRPAPGRFKRLLYCTADVACGIEQRAVDIEEISPKAGNHAGCGRSPSVKPGMRRPGSGRITCCVLSAVSFVPEVDCGGRSPPLMICITSLPSRISRSNSVSAILTSASECSSITAEAVS